MPIPNVGANLWGRTREVQFALIDKKIVDHELVETNRVVRRFNANLQPIPPQKLSIQTEGERNWKYWRMLVATNHPILSNDDVVQDDSDRQYRVLEFEDWTEAGYASYLLAEQPPQSPAPAPYATGQREPIKVLADVLQAALGLPNEAVIVNYQKNIIPKTTGLYMNLRYVGPKKCIANIDEFDAVANQEILSATFSHIIQVDMLSFDDSARLRVEEAVMALDSIAAVQAMEQYSMSIARIPSPPVDASTLEVTARLNRFIFRVQMFAVHRKTVQDVPFFDAFAGEITEGNGFQPFSPAAVPQGS